MQRRKLHISFVGAGNIAWHLAPAIYKKGFCIDIVYNRHLSNARYLAKGIGAQAAPLSQLQHLQSDVLIIAVADQAIDGIVKRLPQGKFLILHTAGSIAMQSLAACGHQNIGVLYPLQSFSKKKLIDISEVPFFIEAAQKEGEANLLMLANSLSKNVIRATSEQRQQLHIAAVFACNFSNAMYSIADKLLRAHQLDFRLLAPLVRETTDKALTMPPQKAQTGPAIRNDSLTMQKHLQQLQDYPVEAEIYANISQYIKNINKNTE